MKFGRLPEPETATDGQTAREPSLRRSWEPPASVAPEFTQAFRLLALDIEQMASTQRLRSIVVASSYPADGRTTAVVNLGLSLAEVGKRVLLVESPGGKSSVSKLLGIEDGPAMKLGPVSVVPSSFIGVSVARIDEAGAAVELQAAGNRPQPRLRERLLDVAARWRGTPAHGAGGQLLADMAGLMQGPSSSEPSAMAEDDVIPLLAARDADYVIFDSPPWSQWAEAFFLGARADGVLYIVRRRRQDTRGQHAIQAQFTRVGARIIGAVFNEG